MDSPIPRATKIVATLGPASSTHEVIEKMVRAGVDVVRLNFSHGKAQDHIDRALMVREVAKSAARRSRSWPTCRVRRSGSASSRAARRCSEPGQKFILDASFTGLGDNRHVGLDYKELPRDVKLATRCC